MRPTFASFVNQAYINVRNAGIIGFPNNVNLRMKHLSFLHMLTTKSLPLCTDCGFWILRCLHHKYFFAISEKRGSLLTFNFSFGITTSGRRQRIHSMPLFTKEKIQEEGGKSTTRLYVTVHRERITQKFKHGVLYRFIRNQDSFTSSRCFHAFIILKQAKPAKL